MAAPIAAVAALVVLCATPSTSQAQTVAEPPAEVSMAPLALPLLALAGDGTPTHPEARQLTLFVDERQSKAATLERFTEPWSVLAYVPVPLLAGDSLEVTARTLDAVGGALPEGARLELLIADPLPEPFALASHPVAGDALRQHPAATRLPPEEIPIDAVLRQLDLLARALASRQTTGPRLLLWMAPTPESFDGGEDESDDGDPIAAAVELARLLSAAGWVTIVSTPRSSDGGSALARETGGVVTASPSELAGELARLSDWRRLTLIDHGIAGSRSARLEVEAVDPALRLRAPRWLGRGTPPSLLGLRAELAADLTVDRLGDLGLDGFVRLDDEGISGRYVLSLTPPTELLALPEPELRFVILVQTLEGEQLRQEATIRPRALGGTWSHADLFSADEEVQSVVAAVEEVGTGRWGATLLELTDELPPIAALTPASGESTSRTGSTPTDPTLSPNSPPTSRPTARAASRGGRAIRLLPPADRRGRGKTRFRVLVTDPAVDRVVFYVDGERRFEDDSPPFAANLDLGPEGAELVRAMAYAGEQLLDQDTIELEAGATELTVRIRSAGPRGGRFEVTGEIELPAGADLDRVEFSLDDRVIGTPKGPPWTATAELATAQTSSFVRMVAHLTDGSWREDVRVLGAAASGEQIEVNLIEVQVVALDAGGAPIEDLSAGDFEISIDGRPQAIERFSAAGEVPILVGLAIDSSASMSALMLDTRRAASQFLGQTLRAEDQAFLVDFDTTPTMVQSATSDVFALVRAFDRLRADGYTALYDAIVFSLLEFEESDGRRAIVLLTDGTDSKSRFGPRRAIEYGRELGVPVYLLDLSAIGEPRRAHRKADLEGIAAKTGGRVFYIGDPAELDAAYARINRELRSQFVLAFSADRKLKPSEIDKIKVRVDRKGATVRAVVAGRQLQ